MYHFVWENPQKLAFFETHFKVMQDFVDKIVLTISDVKGDKVDGLRGERRRAHLSAHTSDGIRVKTMEILPTIVSHLASFSFVLQGKRKKTWRKVRRRIRNQRKMKLRRMLQRKPMWVSRSINHLRADYQYGSLNSDGQHIRYFYSYY